MSNTTSQTIYQSQHCKITKTINGKQQPVYAVQLIKVPVVGWSTVNVPSIAMPNGINSSEDERKTFEKEFAHDWRENELTDQIWSSSKAPASLYDKYAGCKLSYNLRVGLHLVNQVNEIKALLNAVADLLAGREGQPSAALVTLVQTLKMGRTDIESFPQFLSKGKKECKGFLSLQTTNADDTPKYAVVGVKHLININGAARKVVVQDQIGQGWDHKSLYTGDVVSCAFSFGIAQKNTAQGELYIFRNLQGVKIESKVERQTVEIENPDWLTNSTPSNNNKADEKGPTPEFYDFMCDSEADDF